MKRVLVLSLCLIGLILLTTGCAQVAQDVKEITYDDAIEATRRNHETRFNWRDSCRRLVEQEYDMWLRQASVAENNGELDTASQHRARAAQVLVDNFPPLVTVQSIQAGRDAIEAGEPDVYPLDCMVNAPE